MQVELKDTIVVGVSVLGFVMSYVLGSFNRRRTERAETKEDVAEITRVSTKLDTIIDSLKEIKETMSSIQTELKDLRERLIKAEGSLKSAWQVIDELRCAIKSVPARTRKTKNVLEE